MLLYTRLAPPKVPKKRSRAGCTYCKEKKKKCDEGRPQCSRCAERGLECVFEAVKPRQRRRRDCSVSNGISTLSGELSNVKSQTPGRKQSEDSHASSTDSPLHWLEGDDDENFLENPNGATTDSEIVSPLESTFDTASMMTFSPTELTALSPIGSTNCSLAPDYDGDETVDKPSRGESCRRGSVAEGALVARSRALHPDLAMIAPCPVASPLLEFCVPAFSEFSDRPSRRALVDHFCNVLSHLIVFREESGNPFQQLVLPLTKKSTPVMNAIYALASAHLEYRGVGGGEKSLYFHNQAIQGLARLIEHDEEANRNELLAAIMLLVYYEVLVQKGSWNIVDGHLRGALTIMLSNPDPSDPTAVFLERAFRFYDVIAALSFGTAPLSTAPAAGCLLPFPPLGAQAASPLSNVDTLLGMATTLWPIIHRLSNLLSLKTELDQALRTDQTPNKVAVLRTEFQTTAKAIDSALRRWVPSLPPHCSLDSEDCTKVVVSRAGGAGDSPAEKARIHSILNNALAYRHSAVVYLYRTIYEYDRQDPLVQTHTHLTLTHCVATVSHGGPMGALLWPLFIGACEAVSPVDRDLAEKAFWAIDKRQGMMNIERAWDIVREVWRRADLTKEANTATDAPDIFGNAGKGVDLWRRVSKDMGVNIVFG